MTFSRAQLTGVAERALGIAWFLVAWAALAAALAKPQILPGPAVVAETLYTARATFRLTVGSIVPNGSMTWNACSGRLDGSKQKQ